MEDLVIHQWGMVIDLDRCTGCQVCVTACAMENNIPTVGEDEVSYGRGMHWMRIHRQWHGEYPQASQSHRPMLCMQCGKAPCEPVCPVFATLHSEAEQVNVQVYNRCIGTRYCANNCPYVARAFNWYDFTTPEPMTYYLNPDVTVRRRGVMEKCTFCIQRIRHAEDQASAEGRGLQDGDVVPACGQACPTDAIVFGDLADPNSKVNLAARSQRGFKLLEELGTQPKVVYLKGEGVYGG